MCPPGCLHAICEQATRRGLLKAGFGLGVASIAGAGPLLPAPATAAQSVKSFSDVIDLTHPLFEGFPTFDGSKWFSMEPVFTFAS